MLALLCQHMLLIWVLHFLVCNSRFLANCISSLAIFLQATFRVLAGKGYQTLQSLLLEFCQSRSSEGLLNALLDMLVDGKFDMKSGPKIKVVYMMQTLSRKFVISSFRIFFSIMPTDLILFMSFILMPSMAMELCA